MKRFEDFEWEFDDDEMDTDPMNLDYKSNKIYIRINSTLKDYIELNHWQSMYEYIGKKIRVSSVKELTYRELDSIPVKRYCYYCSSFDCFRDNDSSNLNIGRWFPFSSADIID